MKKLFLIAVVIFLSIGNIFSNSLPSSVTELEILAKKKDPAALTLLGDYYAEGKNVVKDEKKALEYYEKAAKKKYPEGIYKLGLMYYYGKGVEENRKNRKKGLENIKKAAKMEYTDAQAKAAELLYYDSQATDYMRKEGIEYYKRAANNGNVDAQVIMGQLNLSGKEGFKDDKKAFEYFEAAAKQGSPIASNYVGDFYYKGDIVTKDLKKAAEYYKLAADKGYAPAQSSYGEMLLDGVGTTKNVEDGLKYLHLAANQKNIKAYVVLGNCYYNGEDVQKNLNEAARYYETAVNIGDSIVNTLNNEYLKLKKDWENNKTKTSDSDVQYKLRKILEQNSQQIKEIAQGYDEALNNLGEHYRDGEGVETDEKMARVQFEMCAYLGYPRGSYNYGIITNYDHYIIKASDLGYASASYYLGEKSWNSTGNTRNDAIKYFKKAEAQGDTDSYFYLGKCYYYGIGTEKNFPEAVKYFKLASELGNGNAKQLLGFCYYFGLGVAENKNEATKYLKEGYAICGPESNLPTNCLYMYANGKEAVYNVSKNSIIIPLSDKVKYYKDEKEFLVINGKNISYYSASGAKLNKQTQFKVVDFYWNQGMNFKIKYKYPTQTEYSVEAQYYNSNGSPVVYRGQQILIANPVYVLDQMSGTMVYSGGNMVFNPKEFRKNTKYLIKISGIYDANGKKVPFTNGKKPLQIYF